MSGPLLSPTGKRTHETIQPGGVQVVLVNMPFAHCYLPSLALGLLQAVLKRQGISVVVLNFCLRFAERLGYRLYQLLSDGWFDSDLAGEWVFAGALFDQPAEATEAYLREILQRKASVAGSVAPPPLEQMTRELLEARAGAAGFLGECLEEVLRHRPAVVGFTSMFQQQAAALGLARRLKEAAPATVVVFGGANCEGVMGFELARQFPFLDAVVSGEGERVFPDLVRRVLAGGPLPENVPGVFTQANTRQYPNDGRYPNAAGMDDLDALPFPDFDDYFQQLRTSPLAARIRAVVPFETSRGCWWGEKSHCTFCGLNGSTMRYRSKSPGRALAEVEHLAGLYPGHQLQGVDNILDMKYFATFLLALAARRPPLDLFYEVKSNLKKEQVRTLPAAGVRRIQPGIESFSSPVLRLMRKGVSGLQNIQLLKWCRQLGVKVEWLFLCGFPGEPPEEYARMADLVPLLTHLPPPSSWTAVRLERFSPYFAAAESFGLHDVQPAPAYRHIYPFPTEVLANLAYYFTFKFAQPQNIWSYAGPALRQIDVWKKVDAHSHLYQAETGEELVIWDLRPVARRQFTVLTGLARALYLACERVQTIGQLRQVASLYPGKEVEEALGPLLKAGLMIREEDAYLSLALPLNEGEQESREPATLQRPAAETRETRRLLSLVAL